MGDMSVLSRAGSVVCSSLELVHNQPPSPPHTGQIHNCPVLSNSDKMSDLKGSF